MKYVLTFISIFLDLKLRYNYKNLTTIFKFDNKYFNFYKQI